MVARAPKSLTIQVYVLQTWTSVKKSLAPMYTQKKRYSRGVNVKKVFEEVNWKKWAEEADRKILFKDVFEEAKRRRGLRGGLTAAQLHEVFEDVNRKAQKELDESPVPNQHFTAYMAKRIAENEKKRSARIKAKRQALQEMSVAKPGLFWKIEADWECHRKLRVSRGGNPEMMNETYPDLLEAWKGPQRPPKLMRCEEDDEDQMVPRKLEDKATGS